MASEVVGLDLKSALASIVSWSSRSLCFSRDIISCDPNESVITNQDGGATVQKSPYFCSHNGAAENIRYNSVRLCRNIMNRYKESRPVEVNVGLQDKRVDSMETSRATNFVGSKLYRNA